MVIEFISIQKSIVNNIGSRIRVYHGTSGGFLKNCRYRRIDVIGARRGRLRRHAPSWPCNKMLKPNFKSIISQTNNGCSLLSLTLAKLLLLDISSENIFALSLVAALTACSFSIKSVLK